MASGAFLYERLTALNGCDIDRTGPKPDCKNTAGIGKNTRRKQLRWGKGSRPTTFK
jgi:hypothetical protein